MRLTSIIMPTGIYQKSPKYRHLYIPWCLHLKGSTEFLFEIHKSLHHASYIVLFFLLVNLCVLVTVNPSSSQPSLKLCTPQCKIRNLFFLNYNTKFQTRCILGKGFFIVHHTLHFHSIRFWNVHKLLAICTLGQQHNFKQWFSSSFTTGM